MIGGTSSITPAGCLMGSVSRPVSRERTADDAVMLRRDQGKLNGTGTSGYLFQNKSATVNSKVIFLYYCFIVGLQLIAKLLD